MQPRHNDGVRQGESVLILNIVDRRNNRHRWKVLDAIVEPTWHDNECRNADQAEPDHRGPIYEGRRNISLADAIMWASSFDVAMTLYLYDEGSDNALKDGPVGRPVSH